MALVSLFDEAGELERTSSNVFEVTNSTLQFKEGVVGLGGSRSGRAVLPLMTVPEDLGRIRFVIEGQIFAVTGVVASLKDPGGAELWSRGIDSPPASWDIMMVCRT